MIDEKKNCLIDLMYIYEQIFKSLNWKYEKNKNWYDYGSKDRVEGFQGLCRMIDDLLKHNLITVKQHCQADDLIDLYIDYFFQVMTKKERKECFYRIKREVFDL